MAFDVCLGGREQRGREAVRERSAETRTQRAGERGKREAKGKRGKGDWRRREKKASLVRVFLSSWA